MPADPTFDEDALVAAVDLVGRCGGHEYQVGYLHDDVPISEAGWFAHAQFRGRRVIAENHPGPVEATEALARRLLAGGKCIHCEATIVINDRPPEFHGGLMADGTHRTAEEAAAAGTCRWRRMGAMWIRGCVETHPDRPVPNRAARRRQDRRR